MNEERLNLVWNEQLIALLLKKREIWIAFSNHFGDLFVGPIQYGNQVRGKIEGVNLSKLRQCKERRGSAR
jgi:hypothetical protein